MRLCNILIRFTEYVFVHNVKNELAYALGLGLTHQEDLLIKRHQQVYRAHVNNIYMEVDTRMTFLIRTR